MSEELKPCPFCGGKPHIVPAHDIFSGLASLKIRCGNCFVNTTIFSYCDTKERERATKLASEVWNTRATTRNEVKL
jgi:Lar family restriction alleviation protein